ncbi:MAG: carotenoid biosynthesis protein [Rhodothermia bacterium]|nr:carotenoid biosynthesis protein [Rhodothermia bacterium]
MTQPSVTYHSDAVAGKRPSWRHEWGRQPFALRVLLILFAGAITFSLGGILLINWFPSVMSFFGPYFELLVKIPTWTYMATLPLIVWLMYKPRVGRRRTAVIAAWGILVGGASELVGTTTGLPFGEYTYTDWLGPKFMGHVPYFIPLSWFAMSLVSFDLASRVSKRAMGRILGGALIMTLWDVSLDPAMSRAFPFWTYEVDGFFYGMPLSNWIGWLVVSLIIAAGIELIVGGKRISTAIAPWFYAANCFFPFALSLLYGLHTAFFVGLVVTALVLSVVLRFDELGPSE